MAEAAGLVLSAVSIFPLVFDLSGKVRNFFLDYKCFGRQAEKLRLRFSVEERRLNSFHAILFQPGMFPFIDASTCLAEKLPVDALQEIIEMLCQLERLLSEFVIIKKFFQAPQLPEQTVTTAQGPTEPEAVTNLNSLMSPKNELLEAEKILSRSISWRQKTLWAMYDKKKAESFISEFEEWNMRIRRLFEDTWWPLSIFGKAENLRFLQESNELKTLGLGDKADLRQLLLSETHEIPGTLNLRLNSFKFHKKFGAFSVGEVESLTAIVDYKTDEDSLSDSSTTIARVEQLAALLNRQIDPRFRVCHCRGYFRDTYRSKIGFVFDIPPEVREEPQSLLELIPVRKALKDSLRPTLGIRFRLCRTLAESMYLLHTVGWVHKSFRSENILFFPKQSSESSPLATISGGSEETPQPMASASEYSPTWEPWIFGFEYSRRQADFSTRRVQDSLSENLYRHPDRWGYPKERFHKIHDIYGT